MKIMKSLVVVAMFALLAGPRALAGGFVRGSGWYVDYSNSSYESKVGGSGAGGITLGADNAHELGVEVAHVAFAARGPYTSLSPTSRLGLTGDGNLTPMLASYRFYFGTAADRVRVLVGGLAGAAKVSSSYRFDGSGITWVASGDQWRGAYGAMIGVAVRLTPDLHLDAGYRYLDCGSGNLPGVTIASGSIHAVGDMISIDALKLNVVELGLTLRF
ncbi:MAG TPA: outer membrane beta-barrel protein [Opitutaceae bacterium]|nr:outer membrane beta-barrel protein [Opitutaceae bacterium]